MKPGLEGAAAGQGFCLDAFEHADASCALACKKNEGKRTGGHAKPAEVAAAFVVLAASRYGLLAPVVLREWGVLDSRDIGLIVFRLVSCNLWQKRVGERIQDFHGVYDDVPAAAGRRARADLDELR